MINFGRDELQRDGVRGGLEQFRWDSVKSQVLRDRECYLGQSVRIGMQGKFGRFQTFDWWQRKEAKEKMGIEQAKLRQLEKQMQEEALGLKPKKALINPAATLSTLESDSGQSRQHEGIHGHRVHKRRRTSVDSGGASDSSLEREKSSPSRHRRKKRHHRDAAEQLAVTSDERRQRDGAPSEASATVRTRYGGRNPEFHRRHHHHHHHRGSPPRASYDEERRVRHHSLRDRLEGKSTLDWQHEDSAPNLTSKPIHQHSHRRREYEHGSYDKSGLWNDKERHCRREYSPTAKRRQLEDERYQEPKRSRDLSPRGR